MGSIPENQGTISVAAAEACAYLPVGIGGGWVTASDDPMTEAAASSDPINDPRVALAAGRFDEVVVRLAG